MRKLIITAVAVLALGAEVCSAQSFSTNQIATNGGGTDLTTISANNGTRLDIVMAGYSGSYRLLRNTGSGYTPLTLTLPISYLYDQIDQFDVGSDPYPDLVLTSHTSQSIMVVDNKFGLTATGSRAPVNKEFNINPVSPERMFWTKLDGDDASDLVVVDSNGNGTNKIIIYYGTTNASVFENAISAGLNRYILSGVSLPLGSSSLPSDVVVGDLDGDGLRDIIISDRNRREVSVYYQSASRVFSRVPIFVNIPTDRVKMQDYDGDGFEDLFVINQQSSRVIVVRQTSPRTFAGPISYATGGNFPSDMEIADVDLDGLRDIVVSHSGNNVISFLTQTVTGSFLAPTRMVLSANHNAVQIGDLNSDGRIDFATASQNPTSAGIAMNTANFFNTTSSVYVGTSNCRGNLGINVNQFASAGSQSFNTSITNGPRNFPVQLGIFIGQATSNPLNIGSSFEILVFGDIPGFVALAPGEFDSDGTAIYRTGLPVTIPRINLTLQAYAVNQRFVGPGTNRNDEEQCLFTVSPSEAYTSDITFQIR